MYDANVDWVLINFWSKLKIIASVFLDPFMCYHYTSTYMGPQRLHLHVAEKQFDEGVNFELRKKALDYKFGYTPIYHLISPLYLEKIKGRVREEWYHRSTNNNGTEGQNSFKRHKDCETGCRNVYSEPENPIESQTQENYGHELIPGVIWIDWVV